MATAAGTALIPVAGRAGNKPIPASRVSRHTRRRRLAVAGAVQLAMFGIGYGVFSALQGRIRPDQAQAVRDAGTIVRLDPAAGAELAVNRWIAGLPWLALLAAALYAALLLVPAVTLAWLWVVHRESYPPARNALALITFGALPVFVLFPLAPPRLYVPGAVDLVQAYGVLGITTKPSPASSVDLYAAMPSLHVAWACWSAWAIARVGAATTPRRQLLGRLVWLSPVLAGLDVIATANHYLPDILAGALLTAVAAFVTGWASRAGAFKARGRAPGVGPFRRIRRRPSSG